MGDKVDKLPNKGLSTNDFTDLLLKKLNGIESGAQKNEEGTVIDNNYIHTDNNFTDAEKNKILQLQQENTELSNNMPWNTVQGKSLHITDSAKYSRNKLEISGDLEQETTKGVQLYDDTDYFLKTNDITIDNEHYITVTRDNTSGTTTAFAEFHTNISSLIKANTVYTYVVEIKKVTGNGILRINSTSNGKIESQFPASQDISLSSLTAGQVIKIKVTSISDFSNFKKSLRSNIRFGAGESGSITLRLSILEGDKTSQPFEYEPFTGGKAKPNTNYPSVPVVCTGVQKIRQLGKNFFNLNDKKTVDSLITVDEDDWISITYNNTGSTVKYVNYKTNASNKIKANTNYALFLEVKSVSGTGSVYIVSDGITDEKSQFSGNTNVDFSNLNNNKIYKYTITSRADLTAIEINTMLRSFVRFNAGQSGSITFRISVLEDTSVTTDNFVYEPYWEQIHTLDLKNTELCAIKNEDGNVVEKDRDVFRNNKWQWEKKIKKFILNGTEDWQAVEGSSATTSSTKGVFYVLNKENIQVTSHFKNNNLTSITNNVTAFNNLQDNSFNVRRGTVDRIYFRKSDITELTEFKAYLSNSNVTAYSILATPEYIDCTAEQSVVLDKLYNNFELNKGTNNITVESSNGVGINMELTYMQDNNLKDKKLEDRVTALENLLSTTTTSAMLLDNLETDLESEVN